MKSYHFETKLDVTQSSGKWAHSTIPSPLPSTPCKGGMATALSAKLGRCPSQPASHNLSSCSCDPALDRQHGEPERRAPRRWCTPTWLWRASTMSSSRVVFFKQTAWQLETSVNAYMMMIVDDSSDRGEEHSQGQGSSSTGAHAPVPQQASRLQS